ncbi:MAG TPA: glycosyltransferase family 39 protein [Planctomycetaceae bacterium]|nr:glycosyltransferase family 39 protein [Planctomycetaceae bacterium]
MNGTLNQEVPTRLWREREFWIVLLLAVGLYAPRLTTLSIRGEESRRAIIAREMVQSGDWVVPRQQGAVRLSRPPLQNWLIAGLSVAFGEMNLAAVRLPGLISTILTVGLIYWYARRRLDRTASLVSAVAYASVLQVLEQGRTGETEPIFTFLVAASLLLWHGCWMESQPRTAWLLGGLFGGLAMLTKGLQAPLYFFGSIWAYLVLTRQWRALFTPAHAIGVMMFAGVVGLWQAAFVAQMGLANGWMIYFWNVQNRFHDPRVITILEHIATFPIIIVVACLAPWSWLLLGYADRTVRQALGQRRDVVMFLAISILVCFPTVWLPPAARPRYFMPLFPCFAVLIGIVLQCLLEQRAQQTSRLWSRFVWGSAVAMVAAAAIVPILSLTLPQTELFPPIDQAVMFALVALTAAALVWRIGDSLSDFAVRRVSLAIAVVLGAAYVGPIITSQYQRSGDLPVTAAIARAQLPPDAKLQSFGNLHHVFLYYFDRPVALLPKLDSDAEIPAELGYFLINGEGRERPELPFAWDQIAVVSIDRTKRDVPKETVIIGRRVANPPGDLLSTLDPDATERR